MTATVQIPKQLFKTSSINRYEALSNFDKTGYAYEEDDKNCSELPGPSSNTFTDKSLVIDMELRSKRKHVYTPHLVKL